MYILKSCITNFMGHDLAIIVMQFFIFISLYGIDMDVIHLFVLFEHQCCVHCLDTNVICLFILFKHECCMFIRVVYTKNLCTWFLCSNNTQYSCLNNMNLWNNRVHMDLEWTHEAYKFVMCNKCFTIISKLWKMTNKSTCNWEIYNKLVNGWKFTTNVYWNLQIVFKPKPFMLFLLQFLEQVCKLRLTTRCMEKNTHIKHNEATMICEEVD
jgi:hypothetical protein